MHDIDNSSASIGTILRRAQRQLVVKRCAYVLVVMVLIAAVAYLYLMGYIDILIDKFYHMEERIS